MLIGNLIFSWLERIYKDNQVFELEIQDGHEYLITYFAQQDVQVRLNGGYILF